MTSNGNKSSGDKIKAFRNQLGLTQKQLAEKAGVATISIQQYELNARNPKIETLQKIATALTVPVDEIRSDMDLEYDAFHNTLNKAITSAYKEMVFQQLQNIDLNFDEVQTLIAKSSKKLTTEEKQSIIKLILSDD